VFGAEMVRFLLHLHTSTPHLLQGIELMVPQAHAALLAHGGLTARASGGLASSPIVH